MHEQLVNENPNIPTYRRHLADSCLNLAVFLGAQGKRDEAAASLERARDLYANLLASRPKDADLIQRLALAYNNLSTQYMNLDRKDEAMSALNRSMSLREQLVADNPDVPRFRIDLSTSLGKIANLKSEAGAVGEARALLLRAIALREGLASTSPVDPYNTACFYVLFADLIDSKPNAPAASPSKEECHDKAVASLQRAVREGYQRIDRIKTDPNFEPLHAHPGFQNLILDLEFPKDPFQHGS